MNPTPSHPDLQSSLLCEDVRQEANGNFIVIGVIGLIRVPHLPITALKLCVFNRWTAGLGQFTETVRLIAPDQTTVLRQCEVSFTRQDVIQTTTNLAVLGPAVFATVGVYFVEVLIDDVMRIRYPVPLIVVPPGSAKTAPGDASAPTSPTS